MDTSHPCGKNQAYDKKNVQCVCADGYGLVGTKCIACGEHEMSLADSCVCEAGYVRTTADGPCSAQDTLGHDCKADKDCVNPVYDHCHLVDGKTGYCTSTDCKSSADCPTTADYACNTRESPSFCERPPTGFGAHCTDSSQCAKYEASYCESLSALACLVNNCKPNPDICYGDQVCCDIALLGTSICIPPDQLESGACPAGGNLIKSGN